MEYSIKEARNKYGSILFFKKPRIIDYSTEQMNNLELEAPFVEILETESYGAFVDIGAGFGYFSKIAAHYAEEVFAFEPHPLRYGFLEWNTRNLCNIALYKTYIGTEQPFISKLPSGMVRSSLPQRTEPFNIPTMRLDEIPFGGYEKVIIKIDVEGNEVDTILSAGDLLTFDANIIWLVEIHKRLVNKKYMLSLFKDFDAQHLEDRKMTEHWKFWREG